MVGPNGKVIAEDISDSAMGREEIARAGFAVSKCEDPFVKWAPGVGNTRTSATDMWLMIAVRPK